MKSGFLAIAVLLLPFSMALAQPEGAPSGVKIKPKIRRSRPAAEAERPDTLLQPDVEVVDAPTSAVLDHMGYSSRTRFFAQGGLLEYINFGVFPKLNLGASFNVDGLVGNDTVVRARAPYVQVKYRFYEGDRYIPSFAAGYDGQGFLYSADSKRYNQRQRGFYIVGSQELGLAGLQLHPSINVSDFDTNSVFAALPLTYNIRDKATVLVEWDNTVGNVNNNRFNAGLRAYITSYLNVDFAVRSIGQGGTYFDGSNRGPERVVQIKYTGSF
jgi:hypothetical protein